MFFHSLTHLTVFIEGLLRARHCAEGIQSRGKCSDRDQIIHTHTGGGESGSEENNSVEADRDAGRAPGVLRTVRKTSLRR